MELFEKPIQFENPEVAEQFECTYRHNPIVHVPKIYRGLLSKITLAAAQALVEQKHHAIKVKTVETTTPQVVKGKARTGSTE